MANPLTDLYGMFNSMLKLPSYAETPASTAPTDPRTGMRDPRVVAEEERKKLLEEEAKRLAEEKRSQAAKQATAQAELADQPFREQMKGREVLLRKESGDLLGAQAAMQDPNYQLGSGSSLRKTPQPLAPDWTRMNRAARRLRRQGYTEQAAQMAGMAELERIKTPSLTTQEQRQRMSFMDMQQDAKSYEKQKTEDLLNEYMRKRMQRQLATFDTTPL